MQGYARFCPSTASRACFVEEPNQIIFFFYNATPKKSISSCSLMLSDWDSSAAHSKYSIQQEILVDLRQNKAVYVFAVTWSNKWKRERKMEWKLDLYRD